MKFGLSNKELKLILGYFESQDNIKKVILYGSRAKDTYRLGSDIDLAIFGDDISEIKIRADLEDLPMAYSFDIIAYDYINNINLKNAIDETGKIIYSKF